MTDEYRLAEEISSVRDKYTGEGKTALTEQEREDFIADIRRLQRLASSYIDMEPLPNERSEDI